MGDRWLESPDVQGPAGCSLRRPFCAGILFALLMGCAPGRVSNLDAYAPLPMNRVAPYPSEEERLDRARSVLIEALPSLDLDDSLLVDAREQVRRQLERLAADVGAEVTDAVSVTEEGAGGVTVSDSDFVLSTRFSTYRYTTEWKAPLRLLWQSEEDIEAKPGTCTHRVEIGLDVELIERSKDGDGLTGWKLAHVSERKNQELDPACIMSSAALGLLFETALEEALRCLDVPLGELLLPRGHLMAHRKAQGGERHLFEISLGREQGIEPGEAVEIRREQHLTSPTGAALREERVIAGGIVTDLVLAQSAWIATDPGKASEPLLQGDVVRPVLKDGLLASLSGPRCSSIVGKD